MGLTMKKIKNMMKINDLNKKKMNLNSKNLFNSSCFKVFFFKYRRSAIAQRQREEEQLKGKLNAEESRRLVRTAQLVHSLNRNKPVCLEGTSSPRV
jgi:hypothetical protein